MNWLFGRKSAPDSLRPFVPAWLQPGLRSGDEDGCARSREGMDAYVKSTGTNAVYRGGAWVIGDLSGTQVLIGGEKVVGSRAAAIAAPGGGTTVDAEARAAIALILATMRGHGLIQT